MIDAAKRFYRPELDALRFFAFLAVLIHHGPAAPGFAGRLSDAGGFGLSMFFLLSAYLITELLLREREQTGTVAWKLFFIRRALRIWPLYFAAIAAALALAWVAPRHFQVHGVAIVGMVVFVANWMSVDAGRLLAPLWSISIEEQFYLIWPPILKFGGRALALAMSIVFIVAAGIWVRFFESRGSNLWFDTPVEFLFFGAGAILALTTHGNPTRTMRRGDRAFLLIAGLFVLGVAARMGIGTAEVTGLARMNLFVGYGGAVAGCTAIFLAILGIQNVPRALTYGGRISYGLYVFHAGTLQLAAGLIKLLKLRHFTVLNMVAVDSLALLFAIGAAHVSYQYFEKPFLRLKERFTIVKSRPA